MENSYEKSNQFKVHRVDGLQKIINLCQTMINEDKEDSQGPEEVVHLVKWLTNDRKKLDTQMKILIDLMNQNSFELETNIEKLNEEKEHADHPTDAINEKAKVATLETFINNPGFQHLAEEIFGNLNYESLENCQQINQSSKEILENPLFWLKKFIRSGGLSKKNQDDWTKTI